MVALGGDLSACVHLVTGKGGTGRTTHALSLGLAWAARGASTLVIELGADGGLARAADLPDLGLLRPGCELRSLSGDAALAAFLEANLPSRRLAKVAASNALLAALFAAAPGTVEIAQLDALTRLSVRYDRIVIDGEATGHALLWLELPSTFAGLGAAGVLGKRLQAMEELLHDPSRFVVHAAMTAHALVAKETAALAAGLERLGVSRGSLLLTAEDLGVSSAALRAAERDLSTTPAAEDLAYAAAAQQRTEALMEQGLCGFANRIPLPWLEASDRWLDALAERGEVALCQIEGP